MEDDHDQRKFPSSGNDLLEISHRKPESSTWEDDDRETATWLCYPTEEEAAVFGDGVSGGLKDKERESSGGAVNTSHLCGTSAAGQKRKVGDGEPAESSKRGRRSRSAQHHNLAERRRRDRINEKMKALQDLIPHCTKTDKALVLDEVIEHLNSLRRQLQMLLMRRGMAAMSPAPSMPSPHWSRQFKGFFPVNQPAATTSVVNEAPVGPAIVNWSTLSDNVYSHRSPRLLDPSRSAAIPSLVNSKPPFFSVDSFPL